jgi:PAS domain S-box-containing protein
MSTNEPAGRQHADNLEQSLRAQQRESAVLRAELDEARAVLDAIRHGEVDALLVAGPDGAQVFTLEGAEQPYRIMVESMSDGAATLAADGTLAYANVRLATLLGIPFERLLGQRFADFITADERERFEAVCIAARGEQCIGEFVIEVAGGGQMPARLALSPLRGPTQLPNPASRLCLVVTDLTESQRNSQLVLAITERKRVEDALRRGEACLSGQKEAFQMAMDGQPLSNSLAPLVRTALEQTQGIFRAAFYTLTPDGTGLRHVIGMTETYARDIDGFAIGPESLACGLALHFGEPVITRDVEEDPRWDSWRWLARQHGYRGCWSFPVRTSGGPIVGSFAMYFAEPRCPTDMDIDLAGVIAHAAAVIISRQVEVAQREKAERALRSELRASSVLHEVSTELIGEGSEQELYARTLNAAATIMGADFASLQMLRGEGGPNPELELLGFRGLERNEVKCWERVGADFATSCGRALRTRSRCIIPDVNASTFLAGSRDLAMFQEAGIHAMQSTPLISRSGTMLGMISTHWKARHAPSERDLRLFDILARQAADLLERSQAAHALHEADRRKDEFLATLAHELRNPLAPIRYGARVARSEECGTQGRDEAIDVIERQTAHMARLLDDLLDISRITRGSLELRKARIELAPAIAAAIESARPLLEVKRHTLTVELDTQPVHLYADGVRITQIFSNLLANAVKYTDPGGQIRLTVRPADTEAVITVRDNGIGISPEVMPTLFSIFSQAKPALERADGGLGIGLALVRGLVQLHGGTITVRSDGPNRGSEFEVRLPRGTNVGSETAAEPLPNSGVGESKLKLLVADDNRDSAELCATLLRLNGHEVEVANTGRRALELAESVRPQVLLLDIGMPELNGYQLAEQIRSASWGKDMILIAITGWGQESDRNRAFTAGFDQHITKPVDPEHLEAILDELARAQRVGRASALPV